MAKKKDELPQSMGDALAAVQEATAKGETIDPGTREIAVEEPETSVDLSRAADEPGVEKPAEPEPAPVKVEAKTERPEPKLREAEDEEEEGDDHDQAEPDWMKALPAAQADYIRGLRGQAKGAHARAQRRAERLRSSDLERQQAVQVALSTRQELDALRRQVEAAQAKPETAGEPGSSITRDGKIIGKLDHDGNPVFDVNAVVAELERRQAPQRAAMERGQLADRMLADAGVSQGTQTRLLSAVREMSQLYRTAVVEAGLSGRRLTAQQEIELLRESGAADTLAAKYGGVAVEDLYDIVEGIQAPDQVGRHMVRAARRYEEQWGKPAAEQPSGRKPNSAKPVPEHPSSMARKGEAATGTDRSGAAALKDLSFKEALAMSPEQMDELVAKWQTEQGARPSSFTKGLGVR